MASTLDRVDDLGFGCAVPFRQFSARGDAPLHQAVFTAFHGAALHPGLHLLASPIGSTDLVIELRADVLPPAVGHAFDEDRTASAPDGLDRSSRRTIDLEDIVAVDAHGVDFECPH